jgi:hypothetical protein
MVPALLVILVQLTFLFRLTFLNYSSFQSDESVYSYASLALARGLVPYREIALYQPPLQYLLMAAIISVAGADFAVLRILNFVIQEVCIVFAFLAARSYFKRFSTNRYDVLALACSFVFACYSTLLFYWFGLNESLFTLLTLGAFALLMSANGRRSLLFVCGVLLGLSILTKYYGFFFGISFGITTLLNGKGAKNFVFIKSGLRNLSCMIAGAITVGIPFLLILDFAWNAFPEYLTQTVYWYAVDKFSAPWERNIFTLEWVYNHYMILIWASLIGAFVLLYWYRRTRDLLVLAPIILLTVSLIFVANEISSSKWVFFHHFTPLLPYFSMSTAVVFFFVHRLANSRGGYKNTGVVLALIAIVSVASYSNFQYLSSFLPGYYQSADPVNALERYIGLSVKNLTQNGDAIWTSEGAIGFFADRIIVAPNSSSWPVRACYAEIFSYDFAEYRGDKSHYPDGYVTIKEFIQSWENQKTKVLVFIKGNGWVPYPDELLWNGFRGQTGVKYYVETNYRLHTTVTGDGSANSYTYEIWVRRT